MIHQVEPWITPHDIAAVNEYLLSGGWITEHKKTKELEQAIASFVGARYAIMVPSGTVGLYLALRGVGITPGKITGVVVPDYTMIASVNSVVWAGAQPILIDIDRRNFCVDSDQIRWCTQKISGIEALIYVDINGNLGHIDRVRSYCRDHGLWLIEDACQAFGSCLRGRFAGTYGDVGVYSFTPHKLITTGQGGCIVTNDDHIFEKIVKLKDFGRLQPGLDIHDTIGYNFKFTDLQAALGLSQLSNIKDRMALKRLIHKQYSKYLRNPKILCPVDGDAIPWFMSILLDSQDQRDRLHEYLRNQNIATRKFYPPIHSQKPYRGISCISSLSVSSDISSRGLWLPSSLTLEKVDIREICVSINTFFLEDKNA